MKHSAGKMVVGRARHPAPTLLLTILQYQNIQRNPNQFAPSVPTEDKVRFTLFTQTRYC